MLRVGCWYDGGRWANSFVVVCVSVGAGAKQVDIYRGSLSRAERREITYFTSDKADESAAILLHGDVGIRQESAF